MKLRFLFGPVLFAAVVLAGCGSSSSSNNADAAKSRAAQIQSAETASGANDSTTSTVAGSSDSSTTIDPTNGNADNEVGAGTCPDTTNNGFKITQIALLGGAACSDVPTVTSSSQLGTETFEYEVGGWTCAAGTDTRYICDKDNTNEEIDLTATKQ